MRDPEVAKLRAEIEAWLERDDDTKPYINIRLAGLGTIKDSLAWARRNRVPAVRIENKIMARAVDVEPFRAKTRAGALADLVLSHCAEVEEEEEARRAT